MYNCVASLALINLIGHDFRLKREDIKAYEDDSLHGLLPQMIKHNDMK